MLTSCRDYVHKRPWFQLTAIRRQFFLLPVAVETGHLLLRYGSAEVERAERRQVFDRFQALQSSYGHQVRLLKSNQPLAIGLAFRLVWTKIGMVTGAITNAWAISSSGIPMIRVLLAFTVKLTLWSANTTSLLEACRRCPL